MDNQTTSSLAQKSVDTLRFLSVDMVQKANSGHPGLPLGAAPMAYVIWSKFLRFNPHDPKWPNRDRFVLSAGHGSALLYSLLHLYGYDLSLSDLEQFRQLGSKTPGHPESTLTPGVEVTTGPLGQGFGNGVGMAIAERFLAARYNRSDASLFDHYIYGIVSDGDLMEGVASEAASLAGHLQLGKIIYLYDDNSISLDGPTSLAFTESVPTRFQAYGWHTLTVEDGNDLNAIEQAIREAQSVTDKPSLISVKTIIGYGSPMQGTNKVHGSPLGAEQVRKTKEALGWDPDKNFYVPAEVKEHAGEPGKRGAELAASWEALWKQYQNTYGEEGEALAALFSGELPGNWEVDLPVFEVSDEQATREASGKVLQALRSKIPFLIGGSADLASSNSTPLKGADSFQPGHYEQSNIWFGVREHGMGAILNGMANYGLKVYGATFLTFSDYMRGAIRLAALTKAPITYIFTHDSVALGEDGPTHQPIEQVASLRLIPQLTVIRPADANETKEAWKVAIHRKEGPVALILTRQKLPVIDQEQYGQASQLAKGAYILSDAAGEPDLILMASGSEVSLILEAQKRLQAEGIKVRAVSVPSFELFIKQDQAYQNYVFPPQISRRLAVEAGVIAPWFRYVGPAGNIIGLDTFGESGEGKAVMAHFGFTAEHVYQEAKNILSK